MDHSDDSLLVLIVCTLEYGMRSNYSLDTVYVRTQLPVTRSSRNIRLVNGFYLMDTL